jgi:hypothetical protein
MPKPRTLAVPEVFWMVPAMQGLTIEPPMPISTMPRTTGMVKSTAEAARAPISPGQTLCRLPRMRYPKAMKTKEAVRERRKPNLSARVPETMGRK